MPWVVVSRKSAAWRPYSTGLGFLLFYYDYIDPDNFWCRPVYHHLEG